MKVRVIENLTRYEDVTYDAEYFNEDNKEWHLIDWHYSKESAIEYAKKYLEANRDPLVVWEQCDEN